MSNTQDIPEHVDDNGLTFDEWCKEATRRPEPPALDGELLVPDTKDSSGLTLRERNFLDLLFEEHNGNIRSAMTAAGYHRSTPVSEVSKKLSKHIKERSKEFIVSQTALAAVQLSSVLIEPDKVGAKNLIAAAKEVLDRGGVFKEEDTKVTEIRNMFILPPKDYPTPVIGDD